MFVNFNILNQLGSPAINSNTFANRPAAGQTGRLFVSTDTFEIYRDNGTTWDLIGGPGSSTITGTGTATQVAYFTSSQAIGSSANLFWDNTSGFLGVATATPSARIEAVKTDGVGIYANFTTNAGSGSSTTALWAKNVTNSSGFAAVIEETTPNATAGQYPLLIKHSLSSGTAGVGMGTGLHFQLPDDAGTFKTTQLTIETINAAAATYATRYRFNVQNNGSSTPVAYINATGLGIFTATPGAALDIHSTGVIAQFNTTSGTGNTYVSFQRTGTGVWRIGDTYNSGANFFGLFNNSISTNAIAVLAATNKTEFTAVETYTTGLARGNYFDYNLSVAAGGSFSSPNAITALGASLDLTLAGNATIPSGARSGLDAYNSIAFTGAGTLTHNQGTQIRAYSNVTAGWAFNGSAVGTITHLAGLRALFPDNTGSAVNVTNNYALLLNDQTANTGTVTYTNRWGVYQEGASDLNYMAANLLLGSTVNNGNKLQVTGNMSVTGNGTFINTLVVGTDGTYGSNYGMVGLGGSTNGQSRIFAGIANYDGLYIASGTGQGINFWVNGSSATGMVYTSSYRLGIGTASPQTILHVVKSSNPRVDISTTDSYSTAQTLYLTQAGSYSVVESYDYSISAGSVLSLNPSGGNVAIGASSSVRKLTVQGLDDGTVQLRLQGTASTSSYWELGREAASSGQFRLIGSRTGTVITAMAVSDTTGNVMIGTTTDAGYKLQVNGTTALYSTLYFNPNGVQIYQFINLGTAVDGGIVWTRNNSNRWQQTISTPNDNYGFYSYGVGDNALLLNYSTGKATFYSSIKTGAPNTGTAAEWKLGSRVAATVALDTTQYIEVDIGGTLYKLAIVN